MQLDQSAMDLSTIKSKIEEGELDLQPDFQRGEVWSDAKKKRLIDTILRNWYIPAIHIVVNDNLDREEVLDGQQRLRTILAFMDDGFAIDGNIEPFDQHIKELHGHRYSDLPDRVRSKFRRFTLNTIRLRDYRPEEPGELFFRLNQLTALTAAEQRNALIGEPRNQIKRLALDLQRSFSDRQLGFSNARMNFDDVLARLAVCLESNSLGAKLTAASLERRYRERLGFPSQVIGLISRAIDCLAQSYEPQWQWKQNKATLFSWLYFICDNSWTYSVRHGTVFSSFFNNFEAFRSGEADDFDYILQGRTNLEISSAVANAFRIFDDRASSRVNDVSSLLLRDLMLNVVLVSWVDDDSLAEVGVGKRRLRVLREIDERLESIPDDFSERYSMEFELASAWDEFREASKA